MCCAVHRVHRIFEAAVNHNDLTGDIHAISTVCGIPRYRKHMIEMLGKIVDEELEVIMMADPAHRQYVDNILNHTLARDFCFTR